MEEQQSVTEFDIEKSEPDTKEPEAEDSEVSPVRVVSQLLTGGLFEVSLLLVTYGTHWVAHATHQEKEAWVIWLQKVIPLFASIGLMGIAGFEGLTLIWISGRRFFHVVFSRGGK